MYFLTANIRCFTLRKGCVKNKLSVPHVGRSVFRHDERRSSFYGTDFWQEPMLQLKKRRLFVIVFWQRIKPSIIEGGFFMFFVTH